MKKTNLLKGALSVLAVSVLLASCTQVDSRIDTVDTLETPSVKAVAYPGVNYISWNAVKGAVGYKVTRTVDGDVEDSLVDSTQKLYYKDNKLSVNDVDVEYKVYALSNRNPSSRAVYVYDSNAGSATVTNIFPPVGTKAIELPRYEKDSGWNFDKDADNSNWKDDFIPTAENIKVELVDDSINVTAPTKAYLTTKVIGYTGNKEEIFYRDDFSAGRPADFGLYQNKMLSVKSIITGAGEYKFKATVNAWNESLNSAYYEQSKIELNTTITIPEVETSKPTGIPEVAYIDNEKTTARVVFTPAVSKDGVTTFAVGNYKVYRALEGSNELVEVTGLKADSNYKNEVIYVVEDKVPSNKVAYDYYVVLSVNGSYENTTNNKATLPIPELVVETSKPTGIPEVAYIDNEKTTARVVFTPAVSKDGVTTFAVENYKVYRALEGSNELVEVTGLKADSRTTTNLNTTPNTITEVIYVVEDKVPSNKVVYDYYVVLNVNGSLEEKKATLTIPAAVVETSKPTDNLYASYIDNEKTTVRVVFTPAVSKDGVTTFAVENYKVYRALNGSNELVEVTGLKADSRTNDNKTEVIYVVEDKVPSNKVAYDYYVVLNVNGSFERNRKMTSLGSTDIFTAGFGWIDDLPFVEFGDDKLSNDVVANVTPNNGSKIVSVSYAYSVTNESNKVLDSAYKPLAVVPELAEIGQAFLIENVPENNYVFVKAEFAEVKSTGKVNRVIVRVTDTDCNVLKANGVDISIRTPQQKKGDTDLLLNDWMENEINVKGGELVSVKYGVAKNKELAKVAAINGKEVTFVVKDYDKGTFDYDYTFDITDTGVEGEYIAIAAEVKAEGKKNNLIVRASDNPVSVSGELPLSISVYPYDDTKANRWELKVDISKYISEVDKKNKPDNYDSVAISYIKTNANYEITNEEKWSDVTTIKFSEFDDLKDMNGTTLDGINYSTTKTLISKPYSDKTTEWDTDYYVVKVVTKYNVEGAKNKEKEDYLKREFRYLK